MTNGLFKNRSGKAIVIIPIVVVVLAALAVGAYFFFSSKYKNEAVNSFSLLMDNLFSQNNWKVNSYDFSITDKTLVANKVSFNPMVLGLPKETSVRVDSIVFVNGLAEDEMANLLNLKRWESQTDTHLADRVTLNALNIAYAKEGAKTDVTVEEITLSGLDLVAADVSSGSAQSAVSADPNDKNQNILSFIKSSRLGKFSLNNVTVNSSSPAQYDLLLTIAKVDDTDLRLGQNVTDLNDSFALLGSYSVKESLLNGVEVSFSKKKDEQMTIKAHLGNQTIRDLANYAGSVYQVDDFTFSFESDDDYSPLTFSMANGVLNSFDFTAFVERITTVAKDMNVNDLDDVNSVYSSMYRLSDIFAMPYTFNDCEVVDVDFSMFKEITLTVDKLTAKGPFIANKLSPSSSFDLINLTLSLPDNSANPKLAELSQFVRDFGQNTFNVSYGIRTTYDENTSTVKHAYAPLLKVDNLAALNFDYTLTGMTTSLFDILAQTSMDDAKDLIFAPEFHNLGLAHFRVEVVDQSLTDKLINYYAKTLYQDPTFFKDFIKVYVATSIEDGKIGDWELKSEIANGLKSFFDTPKSLILEFTPSQPLSTSSAMLQGFDTVTIVNSLNGNFTVTPQAPIPLRLAPPPPAPAQESDPLQGLDLDDFEDDLDQDQ
ncbi:MAG: hypothetical protein LBF38_08030 [Deltaproteobacteria bacterium]|jgi:hypothetical protein|nr:hypothetical protein [Deltaproteobacteria bacterium]